jgi:hypothetical protein
MRHVARASLLFIALGCAAPAASAAELYKWVDEKGQTHYSDQPPAGRAAKEVKDAPVSVIPGPDYKESPPAAGPVQSPTTAAATGADADRARAERRQKLIEECQRNRGVDCERQVDLGYYGAGGEIVQDDGYYYPGYAYPPVVRPPVRPRPPATPADRPKAAPPEATLTPYPVTAPRR